MFSLPMFVGQLLQALYNTVDSIWVGRFMGPGALGAVSISFPLIMALLSLVMGLTMATTTLVAQYRGAGEERMVRRTVSTSLVLLGLLGTALSIIGVVFRYPLLSLVQAPPEIRAQSAAYFGIFMAGLLGMFLYNVLSAILRGLGDSKTPLKFLFIATVVNILLDPVLILGLGPIPRMGVGGAALATILSQGLSSYLLYRWVRKHTDLMPATREDWRPDMHLLKLIIRIGLPTGVQQVLISFGMVVVTSMINSYGAEVVAAYGAASRLDQFGWMPAMSIGGAVSAVVGQNLGADRIDRVRAAVRWSCILATGLTAMVTVVAVLNPRILMVLFTDDAGVLAIGSEYLRIMGWAYIPFALIMILGGIMRGAGDTIPTMIMSLVGLWGVRVPLCAYLSRTMGTNGIWLGIALSACFGTVLHWAYFATGRWMKARVTHRAPAAVAEASD